MLDFDKVNDVMSRYRAPLLKSPFTDMLIHIRSLQYRKECAPYELMYIDCMESYGFHIGKEKCRIILHDMHECVYSIKRIRRVMLMNEERDRQFKSGERKEYPPAPPLDLY